MYSGIIYFPCLFFFIIQNFVSPEIFFALAVVYFVWLIIKGNRIIIKPITGWGILIFFTIFGLTIGLFHWESNHIQSRDIIRDIYYFINPLIFIMIFAEIARKKINLYTIMNTIEVAGGIVALIGGFRMVSYLSKYGINGIGSLNDWRMSVFTGDLGIVIAIVLLLTRNDKKGLNKFLSRLILVLCIIVFVFSVSRTSILVFLCFFLPCIYSRERLSVFIKYFPRIVGFLILILIFYQLLPSNLTNSFNNKILNSFIEISTVSDWNDPATIIQNWRGYETYCAIEEWKSTNLFNQLFGFGFGKKIYVGSYAKLVDPNAIDSIAVLHNGYSTMLIKQGVLGVCLYVLFYILLIRSAWKSVKRTKLSYLSRLYLGTTLSMALMTYFLNGLFKDVVQLILVLFMGYLGYIYRIKGEESYV